MSVHYMVDYEDKLEEVLTFIKERKHVSFAELVRKFDWFSGDGLTLELLRTLAKLR